MTETDPSLGGMEPDENPMRFSISDRKIGLSRFDVEIIGLDIRPSEGNIYVEWRSVDTGSERVGGPGQ